MAQNILTVNAGSSSLKCAVFRAVDGRIELPAPVWEAHIDCRPGQPPKLTYQATDGQRQSKDLDAGNQAEAAKELFRSLADRTNALLPDATAIDFVGHRVVHGGTNYTASTVITDTVMSDLQASIELAPLHAPANIQAIELARTTFSQAKHIAVFDTAFHRTMPESARVYAGPYSWYEKLEIQRFGFHGISHQYCARRASEMVSVSVSSGQGGNRDAAQSANRSASRIITCHIGNGASLCAIQDGKSIMTTMGYTPLDGLVMGTRGGSIDPGILLFLIQHKHYTVAELDDVLNHESGLLGLSGFSSDMRDIEHAMADDNTRAQLAFDIYVNHLASSISSLVPGLGGLDVLVFAGGVGENSAQVRTAVCKQLEFLGVIIDQEKNLACKNDSNISSDEAPITTLVVRTREDLQIATECIAAT